MELEKEINELKVKNSELETKCKELDRSLIGAIARLKSKDEAYEVLKNNLSEEIEKLKKDRVERNEELKMAMARGYEQARNMWFLLVIMTITQVVVMKEVRGLKGGLTLAVMMLYVAAVIIFARKAASLNEEKELILKDKEPPEPKEVKLLGVEATNALALMAFSVLITLAVIMQ